MRILFLIIFFGFCTSLQATVRLYPVHLGSETVKIKVWQGRSDKVYVHLHQNETTALKAAKQLNIEEDASVLSLAHHGQRNIVFYLQSKKYEFDPNRIFTDKGIKASLAEYSHYSPDAFHAIKQLSNEILQHMPKGRVIAVHNNKGYSFKDYLPKHNLSSDAKSLAYLQKSKYRNFYLVTRKADFKRLKKTGHNVVLQSANVRDDGSLSVRYRQRSYINVEAAYDQLGAQIAMLKKA